MACGTALVQAMLLVVLLEICRVRFRSAPLVNRTHWPTSAPAVHGEPLTVSDVVATFVNVGRPVREFREGCRSKGVLVARDFPPFEKSHCRISFGTMEEMKAAVAVFNDVLGRPSTAQAA